MKKIIFVRHGKAEEESHGLSDFERSLTTSGKKVSAKMAEIFTKKEKAPGVFISSPAFRALETAIIFAGAAGVTFDNILIRSSLYFNTDLDKLMEIISELDERVDSITLFGHNPSFSDMPDSLCSEGCETVPKTGVVGISFNVSSWKEIKVKTGKLEYFLKPEKLL
jgi:phosphohistidine phosphatase